MMLLMERETKKSMGFSTPQKPQSSTDIFSSCKGQVNRKTRSVNLHKLKLPSLQSFPE